VRLENYEYMQMSLTLIPKWIQIQYNMKIMAYNRYVHLEMRHAVWGCHRWASLRTRDYIANLRHLAILNLSTCPVYGIMNLALFPSPLLSMILCEVH
jgi:hypothetical protein